MELLDKYGDSDEAQENIALEMGWSRREDTNGDDEHMSIQEMNDICEDAEMESLPEPDPSREGIDWIRTGDGHLHHPLQQRCAECAAKFRDHTERMGLEISDDNDLEDFIHEFQTTSAKLAGALGGIARQAAFPDAGFTVALLKRALAHLHKSQSGLEALAPKKLLPRELIAEARKDLFEIREDILRLMDEFRGRP
jgi:hypothetical protein